MYPRQQLDVLALRKALVQSRIAARRQDCLDHARNFTRPLRWCDEAWGLGRSVMARAKELALPLGLVLAQRFAKPGGRLEQVLSYAPLAIQLMQNLRAGRESAGEDAAPAATPPG